jgi:hypothetical protein
MQRPGILAPLLLSSTLFTSAAGAQEAPQVDPPANAAPQQQETPFLTGAVTLGAGSAQVYRGERLTKEGTATLSPNLALTLGSLVTVWAGGTFDTQSQTGTRTIGNRTETESSRYSQSDFGVTIAKDTKVALLSLGGAYTHLSSGSEDPISGTLSALFHIPLSPALAVTRDGGSTTGWYVSPSVSQSVPLSKAVRVDLGARAGYYLDSSIRSRAIVFSDGFTGEGRRPGAQQTANGESYSGWSDASATASLSYSPGAFSATLGGSYSTFLADRPKEILGADGQSNGTLTGFLALAYSF